MDISNKIKDGYILRIKCIYANKYFKGIMKNSKIVCMETNEIYDTIEDWYNQKIRIKKRNIWEDIYFSSVDYPKIWFSMLL